MARNMRAARWSLFRRGVASLRRERVLGEVGRRFDSFAQPTEIAFVIAGDGYIVRATRQAAETYGYPLEELEGANIRDLRDPASLPEVGQQMARAKESGILRFETRHRRRDGSTFPVEVRSIVLEVSGEAYWWSLIQDITERRRWEERFRIAFEASPDPMALSRLDDGVFVAVNEGFLRLHGFREEEVLGHSSRELDVWRDPAERDALIERVRRLGAVQYEDAHVRAADRTIRILSYSAKLVTLDGVPHLLALARDVTLERAAALERERLAQELRQSEERYRAVLRSLPVVQWAIDENGVFTLSEGRGLEALGLAPGEVVGRSVFDVYRDDPAILADYRRALSGESFALMNRFGPTAFDSHWGPLRDEAGVVRGVTGIALDITARHRAEEQFLQAQKMEAIGRLASGVAHDFNNLLVVILGTCESLAEHGRRDPAILADTAAIEQASHKAANLVRQLLAFARRSESHPVVSSLSALVLGIEKLLRRTIGEHIAVVVKLAEGLLPVRMDPTQFDQLIMNLAVNARDAMPEGGSLTIETFQAEPGDPHASPGRFCCLRVSDTGCGMTLEVKARIFEPFFTTKEPGKGTGLGLAAVFGIVQQAGGHIALESQPGQGTTFTIYFPAAANGDPTRERAEERRAPLALGRRLLVVEDDDGVRRSTARMLREFGFEVVEASTGEEALARAREGLDLVVTDVIMPGMPGTELATRLRAFRPGLPVVFLSGYEDLKTEKLPEGALFLGKPFMKSALLDLVDRALREGPRNRSAPGCG